MCTFLEGFIHTTCILIQCAQAHLLCLFSSNTPMSQTKNVLYLENSNSAVERECAPFWRGLSEAEGQR